MGQNLKFINQSTKKGVNMTNGLLRAINLYREESQEEKLDKETISLLEEITSDIE